MRVSSSNSAGLAQQEAWLRAQGLPFVVPARRRLRGLLPRTASVLIAFTLLAFALLVADAAVSASEVIPWRELVSYPHVLAALVVAGLLALAAVPAGLLYGRWQRRLSFGARLGWAGGVLFTWLFGLSLAAALTDARFGLHIPFDERVQLLLMAAALAWLEFDYVISWAARRSLRELATTAPSVARILPLLMLTVLLVFFTGELWQVAAAMSKTQMWLLGLFLLLLILLILLPATSDMLDDTDLAGRCEGLLAGTPFDEVPHSRPRLTWPERLNLRAGAFAVQTVQVAIFVSVTFAVFVTFGWITLDEALISSWSSQPAKPMVWLGVELPMDAAMFRVCLVLSLFSGVSFAASTLTDPLYRELFVERVSQEVRRNIAARHCYRVELRRSGKLPARWRTLIADEDR